MGQPTRERPVLTVNNKFAVGMLTRDRMEEGWVGWKTWESAMWSTKFATN